MKFEIYESNKRLNGVPVSVMVMEGTGVPEAVEARGVTWTMKFNLDPSKRSRPWADWVMNAIQTILRDGYAVVAFGVVVEVTAT